MSTQRTAEVEWIGGLLDGEGKITSTTSHQLEGLEVDWNTRLDEESAGTSPEELVAAGLSACFAMSVSHSLVGAGWEPEEIKVGSSLTFEPGVGITAGTLTVHATVDGIPDDKLWEAVERAKVNGPVAKALAGVELELDLPGVEKPVEETVEPELEEVPE
jgi:osmotically inducible protein OsmC